MPGDQGRAAGTKSKRSHPLKVLSSLPSMHGGRAVDMFWTMWILVGVGSAVLASYAVLRGL